MNKKLTLKQKAFVDCYTGNATEAARLAGYKGNNDTLKQVGAENLTKPYIAEAINKRAEKLSNRRIATRQDRQEMWTEIMRNRKEDVRDRLTASKLLGASEGDFIQKIESREVTHEEWLEKMKEDDAESNDTDEKTIH